jgi:hypothetical protein
MRLGPGGVHEGGNDCTLLVLKRFMGGQCLRSRLKQRQVTAFKKIERQSLFAIEVFKERGVGVACVRRNVPNRRFTKSSAHKQLECRDQDLFLRGSVTR